MATSVGMEEDVGGNSGDEHVGLEMHGRVMHDYFQG